MANPEHQAGPDIPAIVVGGKTLIWQDFGVKGEQEGKDYQVPGSDMGRNRKMRKKPLEIDYTSLVPFEGVEDFVDALIEGTDLDSIVVPGRSAAEVAKSAPFYIKSSNYTGKINDLSELKITVQGTGKGA